MEIKKIIRAIRVLTCFSLVLALTAVFSCKDNDASGENNASNETINSWILSWMDYCYLWNDHIPSATDKSLRPDDYFESLLYEEDRFSWIQENFTDLLDYLNGITQEAGYDYRLFMTDNEHDIIGIVNYIKPGSPAAQSALKRGDVFSAINGTRLTTDNYMALTDALAAPHTLGIIEQGQEGLEPASTLTLQVVRYVENPVLLDTIYNKVSGEKAGYLVYNFFADDNGDNSMTYAKELNAIFGKFKAAGIRDLILDLRYNGGGAISTCIALSSMISSAQTGQDLFCLEQYNSNVHEEGLMEIGLDFDKSYFADSLKRYDATGNLVESLPINKLTGLDRLFVITSDRTASASELVINCLNPYMTVRLVGETTYGKNVGSFTIYEEDKEKQKTNKWGMQPVIVKLANAAGDSDFGNGFQPQVEISEYDHLPLLPLGDINEPLLQAALTGLNIMSTSAPLRADSRNALVPILSSIDKTPVRRNMYFGAGKLRRRVKGER